MRSHQVILTYETMTIENEVIQYMLEEAQTEWDEDNKLAIGTRIP